MHHFNISLHFPINDYSIIPLFCFPVSLLSYDCNFPVFLIIFFTLVCLRLWCFFVFSIICFPVFLYFPCFSNYLFSCLFVWVCCASEQVAPKPLVWVSPPWLAKQPAGQPNIFFVDYFFKYFSVFHVLIHICMFYISDLYILDDHICMIRMYAIISKLEESGQLHPLLACGSFFQPMWCTLHVDSRHLS